MRKSRSYARLGGHVGDTLLAEILDTAPDQALRKLRVDPTAGKLLRELEAWLHMRPGTHVVDVPALLEPYRTAAVIQLEPEANLVANQPAANKEVAAT